MEIIGEDMVVIKVALPAVLIEGIKAAAHRDSRSEDHIIALAVEQYVGKRSDLRLTRAVGDNQ